MCSVSFVPKERKSELKKVDLGERGVEGGVGERDASQRLWSYKKYILKSHFSHLSTHGTHTRHHGPQVAERWAGYRRPCRSSKTKDFQERWPAGRSAELVSVPTVSTLLVGGTIVND